jgi:hypothetical protein
VPDRADDGLVTMLPALDIDESGHASPGPGAAVLTSRLGS